jgi:hypothetical protein
MITTMLPRLLGLCLYKTFELFVDRCIIPHFHQHVHLFLEEDCNNRNKLLPETRRGTSLGSPGLFEISFAYTRGLPPGSDATLPAVAR